MWSRHDIAEKLKKLNTNKLIIRFESPNWYLHRWNISEILNGESSWKIRFDGAHTRYNSQNSKFSIKQQDFTQKSLQYVHNWINIK